MKKVLISDDMSPRAVERFRAEEGVTIDYRPGLAAGDLRAIVGDYEALIVRSATKVTAEVIAAAARLQVIGRAGTGLDNVDLEAATRRGIVVMNVPGGNTISAAEHTMALVLALARGIPAADRSLREGRWDRKRFVGSELEGKTLGIVGLGRVGSEVAVRAAAFGMQVIAHDPFVTAEGARTGNVPLLPLADLLARADFLTLHAPLTSATRDMIGDKELALMPKGARLVNCARGGIVNEGALVKALESGHLGGAALDVFSEEPPSADLPFRHMDQVILTPHLAASTAEAQEKVALLIADQVCDYLRDGVARNAANVVSMDPRLRGRAAPYLELAETLGRAQAQMLEGRLREITVECSGDLPDEALPAVTVAVLKGYFERFLSGPVNAVNAAWLAKERGLGLREVRTRGSQDYQNLITTVFQSDVARTITGTVFGLNLPRIVALDGFRFDALPRGELLLVSNDDRPGIVGRIGTLLGESHVNIAHMSLGRDRAGGQALAAISVDTPIPEEVLEQLRAAAGILWVKTVRL